ncbi:ferritin-like domain-containing protein [Novosphingobium sp.]|uniref:ferritin-like domain-containing protein n=1 Tax=Novosphingobium sp. TaxID=1874826 RepID=UPI0025F1762E|nr:ferritin-like domain-containing protein [Novosphingobium sp.]
MLGAGFRERYLDVLASIYLYNEHRGYTSLDRVLEAVRQRCPDDLEFQREIEKHRADEHTHYVMFRRWFERQGRMPLQVDRGVGHIDRFIQWVFRCTIEELDTADIVATPQQFERLCRVIMLTEQRGYAQVEIILKNKLIMSDPVMKKIFEIVHRDEPDHFLPYQRWLERQGRATARWNERAADWCIHKVLMLAKLPALFLDAGRPRMQQWPDEDVAAFAH